jgi:thiol-disulfide isomerase/thioredoxin
LSGSRPEARDGVEGLVVTAVGRADPLDDASPRTKVEMFFRAADGLLGALLIDMTDASNSADEEPRWEYVRYTFKMDDIRVNPALDADSFKIPQAYAKVDSFMGGAAADQQSLIGAAAPDFDGEGLDGKPIKLADFRGSVVVLDFWATWCGPCVAAIPHVQKLSEKFAGKPVTVLGINQDRGDKEKVSKFVTDKKITFRHFMDDGSVGQSYLVTGIPSTILIDAKGIVQDVSVGFAEGQEDGLAKRSKRSLMANPCERKKSWPRCARRRRKNPTGPP